MLPNLNFFKIIYCNTSYHEQSLVLEGHYATSEIQSRLQGLQDEHTKLRETWKKRQELFSQCYELQVFLRDAEQRDAWIGTQEAFLSNEDLGVSWLTQVHKCMLVGFKLC